jgi:hypothetical protein
MTAIRETRSPGRGTLEGLVLPTLNTLSSGQARGEFCVWDAGERLRNETAVDLGPRTTRRAGYPVSWYPRACRTHTQTAALRTLHEHAPTCEQCVRDLDACETGIALRRLIREYRP